MAFDEETRCPKCFATGRGRYGTLCVKGNGTGHIVKTQQQKPSPKAGKLPREFKRHLPDPTSSSDCNS